MANYAKSTTRKDTISNFLNTLLVLILTVSNSVTCFYASDLCCNNFKISHCSPNDYCGDGYREEPCNDYGGPDENSDGGGDDVSLEGTVTPEFFNSLINQARDNCAGKGFYSHKAFIAAANAYTSFGSSISKREITAFFAHVTLETEFMCYIEEIDGPAKAENYCDKEYTDFPCPIQLSWNYNYGLCGRDLSC